MEGADDLTAGDDGLVLVLGGSGFVGQRLVHELARKNVKLTLLTRFPEKFRLLVPEGAEARIAKGDLISGEGLEEALEGARAAFYLVHSMGGKSLVASKEFAKRDRVAARNFIRAADAAGLERIIYLGGLGEQCPSLSEHLRSRAEVAEILSSGRAMATVLRAAVIIGAGGASFEMLRYLVERLPVMVYPRQINTRIQPIALGDVVKYLVGCLENPGTAGMSFDIGGPEVLTYREMMQEYAEARGLRRRLIFTIPILAPFLAAYWVALVTPVPPGVAYHLIKGLMNEVVCQECSIDEMVPIDKTPFREAVNIALCEKRAGPGVGGA
jgi:uncharacterized protein YbjT (DUF2867 family)